MAKFIDRRPRIRPVDRQIAAVALPAFAALVIEPVMLLADTVIVGRLGTGPLAGLAVASTVLLTIVGLCVFLAYATTASVGRLQGAGRTRDAYTEAVAGLWLAVTIGVVLAVALAVLAPPVAAALSSSPAVAEEAVTYLRLTAPAVPAMLLVLAATGALRGVLDLRTPLVVAAAATALNAVLSVALVHGLDWGIAGAAVGTTIAQWIAAAWLVLVLLRGARRHEAATGPRVRGVLAAARGGAPLLARTATLRVALLLATVLAAQLGDAPLAAHQVATTVVSLLAFGMDAVAIAGQTLTGRSLGAGSVAQTRALTRRMVGWGVWSGMLLGGLVAALAPVVGPAVTPDVAVHEALLPALLAVALVQPVSGVVFVLDGVLIGAGDGVYLAWAGLLVLALYAPLAVVVVALGGGLVGLWAAYGGLQVARLATLWWRQRGDRWMVLGVR
ncbi:MATE family efflux transporter [Aeromicrobium halocynthiae]|uniref:MATE family efflux transporter n=1 Tax=Aeromicrobium halocynthiae TaxID=560557 RepID=A0ABN2VVW6_9ACTN